MCPTDKTGGVEGGVRLLLSPVIMAIATQWKCVSVFWFLIEFVSHEGGRGPCKSVSVSHACLAKYYLNETLISRNE